MTDITIICLIRIDKPSDEVDNAFPVQIKKTQYVGDLKDLIKEKNPTTLGSVDAKDLSLWKVHIPDDDFATLKAPISHINNTEKLKPTWKIARCFPSDLVEDFIHVIVIPPA